ncbi:hypothetical protein L1049_018466 [Liquidambar formosana]|uniref:RNase H type-1 domain-containing protein n=1 Tax=Liquidambar formosana TaxID=63359 RepID=A0AAP0WMZ1_LIQFO
MEIWFSLDPHLPPTFFSQPLMSWLKTNLLDRRPLNAIPWNIIFSHTCWLLWLNHNKLVFTKQHIPHATLLNNCLCCAVEFLAIIGFPSTKRKDTVFYVSWSPPPLFWHKLNNDRSSLATLSLLVQEGLSWDHLSHWIVSFIRNIGLSTSVAAELWALRNGLLLAHNRGINKLQVEVDAQDVISLITSQYNDLHPYSAIIHDCRLLLRMDWKVTLTHTYQEANQCADKMAKKGHLMVAPLLFLIFPPLIITFFQMGPTVMDHTPLI